MKTWLTSFLVTFCPAALLAAQPQSAPAPKPTGPQVTIVLGPRHGHVVPYRVGCNHTGGGNVDVAQPTPDVVVITMTGVCVATAHPFTDALTSMDFDLEQFFEIVFESSDVKRARLTIEGRVIGLLRTHHKGHGTASEGPARAAVVTCQNTEIVHLDLPEHSVSGGENLSINDHAGPTTVPVGPGKHLLLEKINISAANYHSLKLCKAASAEFAPDPALDPLWISYWEPFHGAIKKDFGFQITIKVAPE